MTIYQSQANILLIYSSSDMPILFLILTLFITACSNSGNQANILDRSNFYYGKEKGYDWSVNPDDYIAKQGDNIYVISKKFSIPVREIIDYNNLAPPFAIHTGDNLKLPEGRYYIAKSGDNLHDIASRYSVTKSNLAELNNIENEEIDEGRVLRIPPSHRDYRAQSKIAINSKAVDKSPSSNVSSSDLAPLEVAPPALSKSQPAQKKELVALPPIVKEPEIVKEIPIPNAKKPEKVAKSTPETLKGQFIMPVNGNIISKYGKKPDGSFNDGINIETSAGAAVHAASDGKVVYAGNELKGYGNLVIIRHDGGYLTTYAHLEEYSVKKGDAITKSQVIGKVGATGNVKSPQLHFSLHKGKEMLNPEDLM